MDYKEIIKKIVDNSANTVDLKRDNANINGDSPMGAMLQIGANISKEFYLEDFYPEYIANAHNNGYIHIHDLDFNHLTTTCTQIELRKMFKNGFNTGHGKIRAPKSIRTYAALAAIVIQANQNDQHGGQSIVDFDYAMGDGVYLTYRTMVDKYTDVYCSLMGEDDVNTYSAQRWIDEKAMEETKKETYQAMEGLIHNLNSMHSRAGAQVPFSSINYGMDTSIWGRIAMIELLKATEAGLGNGETPIFPIQIFRMKSGVNFDYKDPNYDIFKLACRVSAKRLFPNFSNIDAPFNLKYYIPDRPETEVGYMGCRTRVMGNVYDPSREIAPGRGNLSFTSINLPRLALESGGSVENFFTLLKKYENVALDQLLIRFNAQCKRHVYNYPFLMGQGVWIDSDKLSKDDTVEEVLKHGTLSIGFVGLAECLVALTGEHHGESKDAQSLGLKIVKHIRDYCDRISREIKLNVTCLATPAESTCGRFLRLDRERYGIVWGVTDKEYYTNSFHVPVGFKINAYNKIMIEAPYHELTNAGHITYVELDGDTTNNVEAFMKVVKAMHDAGIGYGAINHPVDRDPKCGYNGIIGDTCPMCHRKETKDAQFERIRRITGYLVGTVDRWNDAKKAELKDRVKHE